MQKIFAEQRAYSACVDVFRKNRNGLTIADIAAKTGLPLASIKTSAVRAADEYGAKLSVTESGEIFYSFPNAFKSRYRGAGAVFKKFARIVGKGVAAAGKLLFKVWVMLMLIGYFAFFMLLALAALVLSIAAQSQSRSSSRNSGGAINLVGGIFNMIIRLWF